MNARMALGALAVSSALSLPVFAQTVPIESLQQPAGVTIAGTVTRVVGNRFTLTDDTGPLIVDAGPRWYQQITVNEGEPLRVVGEFDNGEFEAYRIIRPGGEVMIIRSGPGRPPWAGGPDRHR